MAKKIILSSDSTCDLTPEQRERFNVKISTPLHIIIGKTSYADNVTIFPDEIYKNFKTNGTLPKTSAVNVNEYISAFKPYIDEGYEIIHFNIGSAISTSYQNCCIAAKQLGNVYPIDSCSLSCGTALLIAEASDMIEQGLNAEEIVKNVQAMIKNVHASFIIDKLDFLRAGGRCSTIAMLGANLLSLKPSIEVNNKDGSMAVGKKYRGKIEKSFVQFIEDHLEQYPNIKKNRIFIAHSGMPQETFDLLVKTVKDKNYFDEIFLSRASCTISSHCGPNTLGINFLTE